MTTSAPDIIRKLVETFEKNIDSYRSSKNETELLITGWQVYNCAHIGSSAIPSSSQTEQ